MTVVGATRPMRVTLASFRTPGGDLLPKARTSPSTSTTVTALTRSNGSLAKAGATARSARYGGSALGITQLQLAGSGAKGIACQHITVAGPNLYGDVVYTGGVFRKALAEDWLRISKFSPRALELWTGHDAYDKWTGRRATSAAATRMSIPRRPHRRLF